MAVEDQEEPVLVGESVEILVNPVMAEKAVAVVLVESVARAVVVLVALHLE